MLITRSLRREAHRSLFLQQARHGAIVDERTAYGVDASGRLKRVAARQHAAAGRRRRRAASVVHPGKGIEHLKEEDEGGDERPLREALAAQLGHQGEERQTLVQRLRNEAAQRIGRVDDIGVGQQQEFWRRRRRALDALLHRP